MATYTLSRVPAYGDRITHTTGRLDVPDNPIARQMPGATGVSTSAFSDRIIKGMTA